MFPSEKSDSESNKQSDDKLKTEVTQNSDLLENKTKKEEKNQNENTKNDDKPNENIISKDDSASSYSDASINLGELINNLDLNDDNNELTNSLLNIIQKRSSILADSSKEKAKLSLNKKLISLDMDGVVDFIKEKKCKNIIVMVGAGISTSAGIPDFRSPNSGIFSKIKKYDLPSPECIFEINFFKKNPKPFFEISKEIFSSKHYKPTDTHYFFKLLESKNLLLRLYSQNIDGLEFESGLSEEKVVLAHGSFNKAHCLSCKQEYDFEFIKNKIKMSGSNDDDIVLRCEKCNNTFNIIKPDITFYGENLPSIFFEKKETDFPECDLLIIIGTSLVVQPFAGLINMVNSDVPRILINKVKCGEETKIDKWLNSKSGLNFDKKTNYRDVFLKGNCDDIILDLIDKLDWKQDFELLTKQTK